MYIKTITNEKDISLSKVGYLTTTGLMATLITIMTAYICHIPVGVNRGYIHFGDSLIYLSAALLPRPYAFAAAAIGVGMADILTALMWTPATIVIRLQHLIDHIWILLDLCVRSSLFLSNGEIRQEFFTVTIVKGVCFSRLTFNSMKDSAI